MAIFAATGKFLMALVGIIFIGVIGLVSVAIFLATAIEVIGWL